MKIFSVRPGRPRALLLRRFLRYSRHPDYLLKWIFISVVIGVVTGAGAIMFYAAWHLVTGIALGTIVGYLPPDAAGEGKTQSIFFWAAAHPWLLPVTTTLGGLVAGIVVCSLAPEAEGGGQDTAIAAFHEGTPIRARVPFVKLLASAIIIGTGGSAGREGPIAHISAGLGSVLGRVFHLDGREQRIALATGMGAGIGAIFRAPLGGAILAAEILYQGDLEVEMLIPSLIASAVSYSIFGLWYGWNPMFVAPTSVVFSSPPQLLYYVILGVLCALMGRLYAYGFSTTKSFFHRLPIPLWIKPALGGLVVGLIGLALPQVLGGSFGWVQISMGPGLLTLPLWVLLLLPFAKILTTSLSIGSGGSGGIFGPGMVVGGITGALLWRLGYHLLPGLPSEPASFVIVGMVALFGAIAHAPLAMMLMVAEMTGNFSLLAPAMIAVSVASLLVGKRSIFVNQLEMRTDSPAHQFNHSSLPLSIPAIDRRNQAWWREQAEKRNGGESSLTNREPGEIAV